jgi:hypothetical protein
MTVIIANTAVLVCALVIWWLAYYWEGKGE